MSNCLRSLHKFGNSEILFVIYYLCHLFLGRERVDVPLLKERKSWWVLTICVCVYVCYWLIHIFLLNQILSKQKSTAMITKFKFKKRMARHFLIQKKGKQENGIRNRKTAWFYIAQIALIVEWHNGKKIHSLPSFVFERKEKICRI